MLAILKKPKTNSLECTCEKNTKTKKKFTICELCSENKFLRKMSKTGCSKVKDSFET